MMSFNPIWIALFVIVLSFIFIKDRDEHFRLLQIMFYIVIIMGGTQQWKKDMDPPQDKLKINGDKYICTLDKASEPVPDSTSLDSADSEGNINASVESLVGSSGLMEDNNTNRYNDSDQTAQYFPENTRYLTDYRSDKISMNNNNLVHEPNSGPAPSYTIDPRNPDRIIYGKRGESFYTPREDFIAQDQYYVPYPEDEDVFPKNSKPELTHYDGHYTINTDHRHNQDGDYNMTARSRVHGNRAKESIINRNNFTRDSVEKFYWRELDGHSHREWWEREDDQAGQSNENGPTWSYW